MSNEEVSFYKGDDLIETVSTDHEGVAICEYVTTNQDYGNVNFYASIDDVVNHKTIFIEHAPIGNITLTCKKITNDTSGTHIIDEPLQNGDIINASTHDTVLMICTVKNTLGYPMANEEVNFIINDNILETATTSEDGTAGWSAANLSDSMQGELNLKVSAWNVESNTINIVSSYYTRTSPFSFTNTSTTTSHNDPLVTNIPMNKNWILEFDISKKGIGGRLQIGAYGQYTTTGVTNYCVGLGLYNDFVDCQMRDTTSHGGGSTGHLVWDDSYFHVKMVKRGNTVYYYLKDNLISTQTFPFDLNNYSRYDLYLTTWRNSTATVKNVSLIAPEFGVNITTNNSLLSKYHSQAATLTATVVDSNGYNIRDVAVDFFKGDNLLSTATTNDNGQATCEYPSNADGLVYISAKCNGVSQKILLEDCIYSNPQERTFVNGGTTTKVHPAIASNVIPNINNDFVLEYDIKGKSGAGGLNIGAQEKYDPSTNSADYRMTVGLDYKNSAMRDSFNVRNNVSNLTIPTDYSVPENTYYTMKLMKFGGNIKANSGGHSFNDESKTAPWLNNYSKYDLYAIVWSRSGSEITVKNIKIKPYYWDESEIFYGG